ncbi:unnamed protein product [Mucor hiemalis]
MESVTFIDDELVRDYDLEDEEEYDESEGNFMDVDSDFEDFSGGELSSKHSDFSVDSVKDDDCFEEDISFYEDDDIFANTVQKNKLYQVEHTAKNISEISHMQANTVDQVSTLLELKKEDTATLLRFFKWNKEKLVERYMDSPDKVLDSAGISITPQTVKKPEDELFTCEICCDDDPNMEIQSLACGHAFCKACFDQYTAQKILEAENRPIQCPQDQCNIVMDEKIVASVVGHNTNEKYKTLLIRSFVEDNKCLRWCPAPDCEYAIECHIPNTSLTSIVPTVVCTCGNPMCFGCGLPNHQVR